MLPECLREVNGEEMENDANGNDANGEEMDNVSIAIGDPCSLGSSWGPQTSDNPVLPNMPSSRFINHPMTLISPTVEGGREVKCALLTGGCGAVDTSGSRMTTAIVGFTIMLLSVSVGIHFLAAGGFGLLLGIFTGVLAGGILVTIGVRTADHPAPTVPLLAFVRRNAAVAGLVMASCAVTMVSGEADPLLCFATFVLFVLGVSLITIGARGD